MTGIASLAEWRAMAKGQNKPETEPASGAKRTKQVKAIRIHEPLRPAVEALAERRARSVTQLVNDLLLKELEATGYWPTPELIATLRQFLAEAEKSQQGTATSS